MAPYNTPQAIRPLEKTICDFAYSNGYDPISVFNDFLRYVIHGFSPGAPPLMDWKYKRQQNRHFMEMLTGWIRLMQRVESLCREHGGKETSEWMDNHEVCRRLRISPRTLQTLRDNGTLAFTKIGNRTYYRPDDVERVVGNVEDKRKEARWKGKTI